MSYDLPNEPMLACWYSSILMDLHLETHLYLYANNDMYIWNKENCTRNHYAKVRTSLPHRQSKLFHWPHNYIFINYTILRTGEIRADIHFSYPYPRGKSAPALATHRKHVATLEPTICETRIPAGRMLAIFRKSSTQSHFNNKQTYKSKPTNKIVS